MRKASALVLSYSQSLARRRAKPCKGALHDPAPGQDDEALGLIGPLDDLHIDLGVAFFSPFWNHRRPLASI